MKLLIHLAVVAAVFICTVSAKPATNDDDYDPSIIADDPASSDDYDTDDLEDEEDEKELEAPDILTMSEEIYAKAGEDVFLHCNATNADYFTTMWKRNEDIIFQDKHLLLSKPVDKFHHFENRTIVIKNFQKTDEGEYACTILSQLSEPTVTHSVKLCAPPSITLLRTSSGTQEFKVGDGFTLMCEAKGSPPPKITWSLKGQRFDIAGHELTISDAKHGDGGLYQCLADNQYGLPAHSTINIQITQKPVVQIERLSTIGGDNDTFNVELICIVHAVPEVSTVQWRLNGSVLNSNPHHRIRNKNQKHTVTIIDAKEEDFGEYTCVATNDVGSSNRSVHVSNKPGKPKFIHGDHKHGHGTVKLVWQLESMTPVNKLELTYRNTQEGDWVIVNPELEEAVGNMYNLTYTLQHLVEGDYEAMSRAQNSFGWGEYSDPTPFKQIARHHHHTTHHKIEHTDHDQETVLNSDEALKSTSRDSGATLVPSVVLLLATILTIISLRH